MTWVRRVRVRFVGHAVVIFSVLMLEVQLSILADGDGALGGTSFSSNAMLEGPRIYQAILRTPRIIE